MFGRIQNWNNNLCGEVLTKILISSIGVGFFTLSVVSWESVDSCVFEKFDHFIWVVECMSVNLLMKFPYFFKHVWTLKWCQILIFLLRESAFGFIDFSVLFLFPISLISSLIFIIHFLLLTLALTWSFFCPVL